jgi:hypothetical protein
LICFCFTKLLLTTFLIEEQNTVAVLQRVHVPFIVLQPKRVENVFEVRDGVLHSSCKLGGEVVLLLLLELPAQQTSGS